MRPRIASSSKNVVRIALLSSALSGCGGHMAPVSDYSLNAPQPRRATVAALPDGYYRVQSGDTLYSIAWRYDKDYRDLARANNIDTRYRIYPGQLVRITDVPVHNTAKPLRNTAKPTPQASHVSTSKVTAIKSSGAQPLASATPVVAAASSQRAESVPESAPEYIVTKTGPVVWRWPATGRVIQSFGAKGKDNNGLNISGSRGDPVFSAAAGVVVYAGNGLLGYGNLIIVNHDETYLSAYAHNDKLLVKEQDRVDAGDRIAEIGNSGVSQIMLHFEIRKEGKPVDPIRYLPPR